MTVFDDGNRGKDLPTGFSAEVEGMSIIVHYLEIAHAPRGVLMEMIP